MKYEDCQIKDTNVESDELEIVGGCELLPHMMLSIYKDKLRREQSRYAEFTAIAKHRELVLLGKAEYSDYEVRFSNGMKDGKILRYKEVESTSNATTSDQ